MVWLHKLVFSFIPLTSTLALHASNDKVPVCVVKA